MSDPTFELLFAGEGAVRLSWERAERCDCYSEDSRQPRWGHDACGGLGARYSTPIEIRGLFRSRSAWSSKRVSGEHVLGEAQLTTAARVLPSTPACQPGWTDDRVRDRFTVLDAHGDVAPGTVFYPATRAVPFIFDGTQEAWRVQLQGTDQTTRVLPQP